ncbi:MAG: hypothetical protein U5K77_03070 [Candidatus Saccharibacteria bacterium]|nr:hypothetical protein [Candidatus Saccharibacteria bacterium]
MIVKKIFSNIIAQKQAQRRAELQQKLIRHEARIGGQLFGSVAPGGRREFFCLDEHTWVWHEEWIDNNGQRQITTTRYDVRPNGVIKSQNGHYQSLSREEAIHLRDAIKLYVRRTRAEIYQFA